MYPYLAFVIAAAYGVEVPARGRSALLFAEAKAHEEFVFVVEGPPIVVHAGFELGKSILLQDFGSEGNGSEVFFHSCLVFNVTLICILLPSFPRVWL